MLLCLLAGDTFSHCFSPAGLLKIIFTTIFIFFFIASLTTGHGGLKLLLVLIFLSLFRFFRLIFVHKGFHFLEKDIGKREGELDDITAKDKLFFSLNASGLSHSYYFTLSHAAFASLQTFSQIILSFITNA